MANASQTVRDMVWIICNSDNKDRIALAAKTLLGISPSFSRDDWLYIIEKMRWIVTNSDNIWRRELASDILIAVRNMPEPD